MREALFICISFAYSLPVNNDWEKNANATRIETTLDTADD